jgi:hypothetical protein
MTYNYQIREILKVYYECGPVNSPMLGKMLLPGLSASEYQMIIDGMVKNDLLSPVGRNAGQFKITMKGRYVVKNSGWIAFTKKNNPAV